MFPFSFLSTLNGQREPYAWNFQGFLSHCRICCNLLLQSGGCFIILPYWRSDTHLYKLEIPDVGLNPFEVITGRPMSLPASLDLRKADCHLTRDALLEYYVSLTNAISSASQQLLGVTCQREAMKIQKEPLGSKWEGPFQVLLTMHVAVKVLESDTFSCSQATALHHAVKISSRGVSTVYQSICLRHSDVTCGVHNMLYTDGWMGRCQKRRKWKQITGRLGFAL